MNLVLGMDAAWGGTGWCLGSDHGPLAAGHVALAGRSWRFPALVAFLTDTIANEVADGQLLRGPMDASVRLVIEMPPAVYSGAERWAKPGEAKRPAGNQALTGYGLGTLSGAIQLWWVMQPGPLGYPWLIEPRVWRKWMGVGGTGRLARKKAAVESCRGRGWGKYLDPHPFDPKDGGAQADVAEALLLTVGAARNIVEAPAGPRQAALPVPRRAIPTPTPKKTTLSPRPPPCGSR